MLVLSFSGTGENSLTLRSLEVLESHPEVEKFDKIIIGPNFNYENIDSIIDEMHKADAIIWAVSPFHMNIQAHMLNFFSELRKRNVILKNINTFFQTNVRVCDNFLTATLERQIKTVALVYVPGLSYATSDMINQKMSLYTISSPDKPPKKKIFSSTYKYTEGEGLRTAVQWYKILREFVGIVNNSTEYTVNESTTVLFVDMEEDIGNHSEFVTKSVDYLKQFYTEAGCKVLSIAQRDYNVRYCDGCKLCYATKECKIVNDDYVKYENDLSKADIILYYGKCENGFISSLAKKMIDRGVHNGLMPAGAKMPTEMDKFRAVGYILDADADSYAIFKEYAFCLSSFGFEHFLGILAQKDGIGQAGTWNNLVSFAHYSLLVVRERMLPQRNFWTEKVGRHFADLSRNIPSVIPMEAEYYRKAGGYDDVPVDHNAGTIMPSNFNLAVKMRQVPYDATIKALNGLSRKSRKIKDKQ